MKRLIEFIDEAKDYHFLDPKKRNEINVPLNEFLNESSKLSKSLKTMKKLGLELGDKVEFIGVGHPAHVKNPIKLTGVVELHEITGDEIGIRSDGYNSWHTFDSIDSEIKKIK